MEAHQKNKKSSEKGVLKVKLKMPNIVKEVVDEEVEEAVDIREEIPKQKEHICGECGKQFSSGKALGGHMSSAHVQANNRDYMFKKQLKVSKGGFLEEGEVSELEKPYFGKIVCDICRKNFPSKKSLFGHMRCHPDRNWRGMQRPNNKNVKNNHNHDDAADDDNYFVNPQLVKELQETNLGNNVLIGPATNIVVAPQVVDLKGCLTSWGVTDKRGRSAIIRNNRSRSNSISSSEQKDLQDAVHQLIRLVNGDNISPENRHKSEVLEAMCSNSVTPDAESNVKELPLSSLIDKPKRKAVVVEPTSDEENTREICYSGIESTDSKFKNSVVNKKRRVDQKGKDVSPIKKRFDFVNAVTPEKYKCNICDKSFTSHQALGGHRSSHNKFKITIENTVDHHQEVKSSTTKVVPSIRGEEVTDVHQLGEEINCNVEQVGSNNMRGGSENIHKCKVCDKSFPTGQALGGHQRCHWSNQDESSQNVSKVLDFDLNELPHVDDGYR